MNAALFRHSAVHNDVAKYLNSKRPDLRWLLEFDHRIIRGGKSIEYIIDIAGLNMKTKSIEIAVEIAATTQRKDGGRKHSDYELSRIPFYLLVDCISGTCSLFAHSGAAYEPIDINLQFPELPALVAEAIRRCSVPRWSRRKVVGPWHGKPSPHSRGAFGSRQPARLSKGFGHRQGLMGPGLRSRTHATARKHCFS